MNPTRHFVLQSFGCKSISVLFSFLFFAGLASAQLSVSISGTSPTCNGWTNGSVSATATGGTAPYTYAWSNGVSGAVNGGIGAGTYSVTATDANNQTASATFTLTQPAALSVSVALADVCSGNGNATATVSGGTGPFTYSWGNGASGSSVTGLPVGFNCVTVTDASGCQAIGCTNVAAPLAITMVVKGLACFNFCDASIEAVVTGGTGPYTYLWSNGATGSVNENLGPGTYSVTVTDANGCTITGSATVGNPAQINISVSVTNPPCGGGATGTATATVSGGSGPYQFLWSNGATTATITGLAAGTYGLTVTDANGCTNTSSAIIVEQGNLSLQVLTTASSGCGAPDGTASVIITGGTAPYNILWSNGSTASDVLGLAPGNYTVVVTDANGCGASGTAFIGGALEIDLHISGVNAGCANNGSANAMVQPGSGTAPFTFLWNTGATTPIINNLTAGTYTVTVTDAALCTATASVTVTGSANVTITATSTNVSCFGGNNGTASATATGGTPGSLFFVWSNGAMTQNITGLTAGTYFVTVMDVASGCTATTATFVSQPQPVTATATATNATCTTLGSATASASGGTGAITFKWSNGATTASITGLTGGTYTVTATDANGCTGVATATVTGVGGAPTVNINVDSPLSGNGATDGALTAQVTGGAGPYTYLWNTGATTASITGLGSGTYSVTVTDANGCTDDDTETLTNPGCIGDRIWLDLDKDGCQDANLGEFGFAGVTLTLTGTTTGGVSVNQTTVTDQVGQYLFTNLAPGTYQVKITLPNNYTLSPANSSTCGDIFSSSDFLDSDFNANGSTGNIVLAEGQCNLTIDGGLYDICINVSDPGTICCDQTLCGPGVDPAPITSLTPASGGQGPIQYMWMYSHQPGPFNNATWFPVEVNGMAVMTPGYDPGPIYETTYFIRCVKTEDCDDWLEGNIVTITVDDVAVANISGPDVVCVGDPASYSSTGNNPGSATYLWNFGNWATPSTSTSANPTVTWNTAGVVYITLTVTVGSCVSTDVLGISISDSPIICGSALVINTVNMGSAIMVEWNIPHTAGAFDFVVQRSKNGVQFEDIGTVAQANGAGTHQYAYADHSPKHGNSFYRLDVRSNGNHLIYSNVERVSMFSSVESFVIRPNPVTDHLIIECSNQVKSAVKMEVMNLQGKLISSQKLDESLVSQPVDLSHLSGGVYLLRLTYNDGIKEIHKIVKE